MPTSLTDVKAVVFDVFGTVVDWRGSIIRELEALGHRLGISRNWGTMADRWRDGYYQGTKAVLTGERPWVSADFLHLERLELLKDEFGLDVLTPDELEDLNRAWHRLTPWPDSVEGLTRLKQKFIIGTLSNGNNGLLVHMAKNAGLPWDIIMGGENFASYKPSPKVYLGAVESLGYQPHEVMVAAAHLTDLGNAHKNGLRTGFVPRPLEFGGPGSGSPQTAELAEDAGDHIDLIATDFNDLAAKLGA
ncbi:MAG: haloacid dehalogenase type II [Synoicihabitans sp.]